MSIFLKLDKAFYEAKLRITVDKFIFLFKKQTQVLDIQKISVSIANAAKQRLFTNSKHSEGDLTAHRCSFWALPPSPLFASIDEAP